MAFAVATKGCCGEEGLDPDSIFRTLGMRACIPPIKSSEVLLGWRSRFEYGENSASPAEGEDTKAPALPAASPATFVGVRMLLTAGGIGTGILGVVFSVELSIFVGVVPSS